MEIFQNLETLEIWNTYAPSTLDKDYSLCILNKKIEEVFVRELKR